MINATLRLVILVAIALYFAFLLRLLKRRRLNLKYALMWIFSGVLMLALDCFPEFVRLLAKLLGIGTPVNAVFTICAFCGMMMLMSLTSIVSKLNRQNIRMIQTVALLERRLDALENAKSEEIHP